MIRLAAILFLLHLWSCANQVQPQGGPRDETPPQLVLAAPRNGDINVKYNLVTLTFDEFVTLDNIKENLIITPRIDFEYDTKVKKKTVTIEFEEPLNENTTYTLNFREGIVDLTEGNSAEDMVLAFSTGPLLDTLEIYGAVVELMTQAHVEKVVVGLYDAEDSTDLFNSPPLYFTNTLEDGTFRFRNIKDGSYRLYAFTDPNKNLLAESQKEAYAWHSDTLALDTALIIEQHLQLQYLNVDSLQVRRVNQSGHYVQLSTSKTFNTAFLKPASSDTVRYKIDDDYEGLQIYNTFPIQDSLEVTAYLEDSTGFKLEYPFYLSFAVSERKKDDFKTQLSEVEGSLLNKTISGEFKFDKPIERIELDSMRIERDSTMSIMLKDIIKFTSDTTQTVLGFNFSMPTSMLDSLTPQTADASPLRGKPAAGKSPSNQKFTIIVPRGTFYSVEGDTSELIQKEIRLLQPERYGVIEGAINTVKPSYVIQLINQKNEVVKEAGPGKTFSMSQVTPGEYRIRILVDSNENGRWDPGDIRKGIQPEPVIIYMDEKGVDKTSIRANWEMTLDLYF